MKLSLQNGKLLYSDIAISHIGSYKKDPKRNIKIFNNMLLDGVSLTPREQFYYARELYYNKDYNKSIDVFDRFLNSKKGWLENNIEACLNMSYCFKMINRNEKALKILFKSFEYDLPRAEICCEIGLYFLNIKKYNMAIFWYKLATNCEFNDKRGGFVIIDCYNYIPYIQLSVCYEKIKDRKNAILYNNKAGSIKPNDEAYLYNKSYFKNN